MGDLVDPQIYRMFEFVESLLRFVVLFILNSIFLSGYALAVANEKVEADKREEQPLLIRFAKTRRGVSLHLACCCCTLAAAAKQIYRCAIDGKGFSAQQSGR